MKKYILLTAAIAAMAILPGCGRHTIIIHRFGFLENTANAQDCFPTPQTVIVKTIYVQTQPPAFYYAPPVYSAPCDPGFYIGGFGFNFNFGFGGGHGGRGDFQGQKHFGGKHFSR